MQREREVQSPGIRSWCGGLARASVGLNRAKRECVGRDGQRGEEGGPEKVSCMDLILNELGSHCRTFEQKHDEIS